MSSLNFSKFQDYCKNLVYDYLLANCSDGATYTNCEVYVVWYCKTLQNAKALLSTDVVGDSRYFEITYDGDKDKFYFDCYTKEVNLSFDGEMIHG